MPITMMFAADQIKANYFQYATDYRVLVEAQIRHCRALDLRFRLLSSDPAAKLLTSVRLSGTLTIRPPKALRRKRSAAGRQDGAYAIENS